MSVDRDEGGAGATVTEKAGGFEDPPAEALAAAAAAFGLLAAPARLRLMWVLSQGESDVTHLADRVGGALPAVSQHLAKLKLAGLVRSRRDGRRQIYRIDDPDVMALIHAVVGRLTARSRPSSLPAQDSRRTLTKGT